MEQVRKHSRKRDAILTCLRSTRSHPSAEWIYRQLKDEIPDLSLGTVYRNLSYFVESGEALSLGDVSGQERFDGDTHPHAHFVCSGCGSVLDIPDGVVLSEEDERQKAEVEHALGVQVRSVSVQLSGLCPECLAG